MNSTIPSPPPFRETLEKRLLIGFTLITVILLLVSAAAWRNTLQTTATRDWVNHTHAVILEAQAILSSLHASEAALRDYLIRQDAPGLDGHQKAVARLKEHLAVAAALGASEPREKTGFDQIQQSIEQRLAAHQTWISQVAQNRSALTNAVLSAAESNSKIQPITGQIRELIWAEGLLLQQSDIRSNEHARATRRILFLGVAINFLLLAFSFYLIRRDLKLRREATALLQKANDVLESKVQERTAALSQANHALEIENIERQWSHQAAQRLCRHNERIINSVADGIVVLSRTGNVLRVNPAAAQMSGYEPRELVGRRLQTIVRPSDSRGADPFEIPLDHPCQPLSGTGTLARKDGTQLAIRLARELIEEEGQVVSSVITLIRAP